MAIQRPNRESTLTRDSRHALRRRGVLTAASAFLASLVATREGGTGEAAAPGETIRLLYDMQAPETWAEDFGEGTLANGRAEIAIASDFASVVDLSDYHVFLTPHDPTSKGLAVAARQADRFVVQELGAGTSATTFSWRLVAHPKGQKVERMPPFQIPNLPVVNPPTLPTPPVPPLPAKR